MLQVSVNLDINSFPRCWVRKYLDSTNKIQQQMSNFSTPLGGLETGSGVGSGSNIIAGTIHWAGRP